MHGIKTTIPFFVWALDDPDFVAGRFDTSFIDGKLAARAGVPFDLASAAEETTAAIAAALHLAWRAPVTAEATPAAPASRWRHQARVEALG